MADYVKTVNRLQKYCNPTALELHSDCTSTAPTIPNSAALSTVAGVRRFIRTQARRGGQRHDGQSQERTMKVWTWIRIRKG